MHHPETVVDLEFDFDNLIQIKKSDLIIVQNQKKIYQGLDIVVPEVNRIKMKVCVEKIREFLPEN